MGLSPTRLPPLSPPESQATAAQRQRPPHEACRLRGSRAGRRGPAPCHGIPPGPGEGDRSCQEQAPPPPAPPRAPPPRPPCAASAPLLNMQITPVLRAVIGCRRSDEATPPRRSGAVQRPLVRGRERRNAHGQLRRAPVTPARPPVAVTTPPPPLAAFIQSESLLAARPNGAAIC